MEITNNNQTVLVIDPVCGMKVKSDKHSTVHNGKSYYFCGTGCKEKFIKDPTAPNVIGIDPVCRMKVKVNKYITHFQGESFVFCSGGCKNKFINDPQGYLNPKPKPLVSEQKENLYYICPMCPEVREVKMMDCPICGMALEPVFESFSLKDFTEDLSMSGKKSWKEIGDYRKRFWGSLPLIFPVFFIEMDKHFFGLINLSPTVSYTLQLILTSVIYFWVALPINQKFVVSLKNKSTNMWTLIGLGTGIAYFYSIVAFILNQFFPSALSISGGLPIYFESTAVIIGLVLLGQILELRARNETGTAIHALLRLFPQNVIKVEDGRDVEVTFEDIKLGDKLKILPGEKIPVDGIIEYGNSAIDESMLTGESIPVEKNLEDEVIGGSVNGNGVLIIKSQKIGSNTFLAKVIESVVGAKKSRPQIQRYADTVSQYFIPIVIGIAIISFCLWLILGPTPAFPYATLALVSVLIIACPCAIGLATPMSIMVSAGLGAHNGLVIKDFLALETFALVKKLIVDKTGTLTEGKPRVTDVIPLVNKTDKERTSPEEIIAIANALEVNSNHPLANAIKTEFQSIKKTDIPFFYVAPDDFESKTGMGLVGKLQKTGKIHKETLDKKSLISVGLGNRKLMEELKASPPEQIIEQVEKLSQEGKTVLYVFLDGKVRGIIAVADRIRQSAVSAIKELHKKGIEVVMATGDKEATASYVASKLDITYKAEMMPEDKAKLVRAFQKEGFRTAMTGDGINDSPALAVADVSIAMGSGSDAAIEISHVTLIKNDLQGIVKLLRLSKLTLKNIKQSLFFAFLYNSLGVPLAAGILYPWIGVLLSPMIASLAMSLSSVSVIGNALSLRLKKL